MLLPSALPCDFLAPSLATLNPPARTYSPAFDQPNIVSAAASGLFQSCRRLHSMLSLERSSPAPMPINLAGIRKSHASSSTLDVPSRRAHANRSPSSRTPARRGPNKRTRSEDADMSEDSDKDFNRASMFATPQRAKRTRLTTPPPAPNRGPARVVGGDEEEWSDEQDRMLVEMVIGKLHLTKSDWEECAIRLGKKDSRVVGKRWEDLVGTISIRNRRHRVGAARYGRRN